MNSVENITKKIETGNSTDGIRNSMQSLKEDGNHMADAIIEQGQDKYNQMRSFTAHYIKSLEKEVISKPIQSIGIAVGAGMIISFLLRRG